ncbi:hypothetical protein [Mycobacterium dioxanotrophicus]|uniref:hypothetical protein n=1 Tax=Mycobacterium dioxanotrophicus TaxID=482462 RepID=UPI0012F74BC7|nr:hypothetical protein [Mycobacterium dioxanotrophicus]
MGSLFLRIGKWIGAGPNSSFSVLAVRVAPFKDFSGYEEQYVRVVVAMAPIKLVAWLQVKAFGELGG